LKRDKGIGIILFTVSVITIVAYGWLLYGFPIIVLQVTAFVAVAGVLAVLAWIGWTLATTPPAPPIAAETKEGAQVSSNLGQEKIEES
jgi:predicted DNA-binding transcriptional regulator